MDASTTDINENVSFVAVGPTADEAQENLKDVQRMLADAQLSSDDEVITPVDFVVDGNSHLTDEVLAMREAECSGEPASNPEEFLSKNLDKEVKDEAENLQKLAIDVATGGEYVTDLQQYPGITSGSLSPSASSPEFTLLATSLFEYWDVSSIRDLAVPSHLLQTGKRGETLLHTASAYGHTPAMEYFITMGIPVNSEDAHEMTPLHYVALASDYVIEGSQFLIERGADLYATSIRNNNVAHFIPNNPKISPGHYHDWVQYIMRLGHRQLFRMKGQFDETPVHAAMKKLDLGKPTMHLLLGQGVNVNDRNSFGNTMLLSAALQGRGKDTLETIVKFGGDWTLGNSMERGVLHHCVDGGNVEGTKYFIELGADVNVRDINGEVPLQRLKLAEESFVKITKLLVESGADGQAADEDGNTVAHGISLNSHITPEEYHEWTEYMLQMGYGELWSGKGSWGRTPLHNALKTIEIKKETVELVAEKTDFVVNDVDFDGCTILLQGAHSGRSRSVLEAIVDAGGDWKVVDNYQRGVLHHCVAGGNVEALKYFISLGADINGRAMFGETPFHKTRFSKDNVIEMSRVLVDNGADVFAVDNLGNNVGQLLQSKVSAEVYEEWKSFMIEIGYEKLFV